MRRTAILSCLLIFILLSASAYAAGAMSPKSYTGDFTGANSPAITVGGNCPPLNARMDVTGKCEGSNYVSGDCSKLPVGLGLFQRHDIYGSCGYQYCGGSCGYTASFTTGEACTASGSGGWDFICCYVSSCPRSASCGVSSYIKQEGLPATCNAGANTYYTPCAKDPQAVIDGVTWKYTGFIINTSSGTIPIGTYSNPMSSPTGYVGVKVPAGNLKVGSNTPALSAQAVNKFNYTLYWTEETLAGGGDRDGDGYYNTGCTLGNDCDDNDPNVNPGHVEVPGNGKDDNCDGTVDTLYVNTLNEIKANCPYNAGTKTYSCTGWKDILISNDIALGESSDCPWGVCGPCDDYTICGGAAPRNINFEATNSFSARNFYADNPCGNGGALTIKAKNITATSLNTYGSTCRDTSCTCSGPYCGSNSGGPLTLTADTVTVTTLNSNDGQGRGGSGGTITVNAKTANIQTIYSSGAGYYCSYDYGYDDGPGSGGSVTVKAGTAAINAVYMDAGSGSYCGSGGSGGSAKIVGDKLTLGTISANGNYPGGSGGSTKIYADNYTLTSISENGASGTGCGTSSCCRGPGNGGFVGLFADANFSTPSLTISRGSLYYCNSCYGCCWWMYGADGTIKRGNRTGGGFFVFETNLTSPTYRSFGLSIQDALTGANVKSVYGIPFAQDGAIESKYIKAFVGMLSKLKVKLGKDYILTVTASSDPYFESARCASGASCVNYTIPFTEY